MEYQTTYALDFWGCFLVPIFSQCPLWSCFLMANMPTKCLLCLLRREENMQQINTQGDAHAQKCSAARYQTQICARHLLRQLLLALLEQIENQQILKQETEKKSTWINILTYILVYNHFRLIQSVRSDKKMIGVTNFNFTFVLTVSNLFLILIITYSTDTAKLRMDPLHMRQAVPLSSAEGQKYTAGETSPNIWESAMSHDSSGYTAAL